jgi:hypothetical protein
MGASQDQRIEIVDRAARLGIWPQLYFELRREYPSALWRKAMFKGPVTFHELKPLSVEQADEVLGQLRAATTV